ncbi:MAG: OmpA family protein [Geminicoccaceae bacterium]
MESFLSLPRSAKSGLAVLLAVALLGWAIVAYSAKRQHDGARSLENALATIKSQGEREEAALSERAGLEAERASLEERLATAEADLSTSREAMAADRQEKSEIEARLTELEAELAEARELAENASGQGGALALVGDQEGTGDQGDAEKPSLADTETLRARLTKTMTTLSAKNATLQQRERDLASALEKVEAADAEIQTLTAGVTQRDVLRARLTETMTTLSAKNATLQQRERDLASALEKAEAADAEIQALTAGVAQRDVLRARLTETMTKLSAQNATLQQRERDLASALEKADAAEADIQALEAGADQQEATRARLTEVMTTLSAKTTMLQQRERELEHLKEDQQAAEVTIAALETAVAEHDESGRSVEALATKLGTTKQALDDSVEALKTNQQALTDQQARLGELQGEQASIEVTIDEKRNEIGQQEQKLAELSDSFGNEEQRLASQRQEIDAVKAELADLAAAREESEAESSSLIAEIDGLEASLSEKEDAIAYAKTELERLEVEIASAEQQLAERQAEIVDRQSLLSARDIEIQGVEASLAALKADRDMAEAKTVELKTTINHQEAALQDFAALKSKLDATKAALAVQTALLDEKQGEVTEADARLADVQKDLANAGRSLPQIPIAALSHDNLAVLPIDPMQHPFPVQTKNGVRLALVHFDLGSAELTPGGLRRAKEAAAWIKEQGVEKIRLVGTTDTIGTKQNNMVLARRRAQALFDAFAAEGIDPDRIELISVGEAGGGEAIDDHTAEPLNRCVSVLIGGDS